jgi:Zn-finger protein
MNTEKFKFVQNRECEYFPCHRGIPIEEFNCLFCFCPLYMLKDKCGGNFIKNGDVKDCSKCNLPHSSKGYDHIMSKIEDVIEKGSDF